MQKNIQLLIVRFFGEDIFPYNYIGNCGFFDFYIVGYFGFNADSGYRLAPGYIRRYGYRVNVDI